MRRKRVQNGSVSARGRGSRRYWHAQWREEGEKQNGNLGLCSEVTRSQAKVLLAQIVQPINLQVARDQSVEFRFAEYVKDVFLPAAHRRWKESTRSTSEADTLRYLIPTFGSKPLQLITRPEMQSFLDQLALRLSTSIVGHLRLASQCNFPNGKQ